MSPLEFYHEKCRQGAIFPDAQQLIAMEALQAVYERLCQEKKQRQHFWYRDHLVKGVYLWGSVGIGKTFMMDCFYQCLPFAEKMRIHFYKFMEGVHQALRQHQGEKNPLDVIAKEISKKTMVLCFDELLVTDITDAMLLGRLFTALFKEGVCLVVTSNSAPDDLYKNGLQRSQFLPAIALLKQHTHIVSIPTQQDYRLRHVQAAGVFYSPLDALAERQMEDTFVKLTQDKLIETKPLMICGRPIPVKKRADDVVWFDFADICRVPRSQQDYLAIANLYRTVMVSDIPVIGSEEKDTICLFISLVDVFYDAGVRLVISAAEPVTKLYQRGYMQLEYARTQSRLQEMQSQDYFSGEFNAPR